MVRPVVPKSRLTYIVVTGLLAGCISAPCVLLAMAGSFSSTNPWGRVVLLLLAACSIGAVTGGIGHYWQNSLLHIVCAICGGLLGGVVMAVFIGDLLVPTYDSTGSYIPVTEAVWTMRRSLWLLCWVLGGITVSVLLLYTMHKVQRKRMEA